MAGQLRITGGRLVRRRFQVPHRGVRPTSDKAREALFSVLGNIEDLVVADLCAGSGALAFEAVSRGARYAVAVEKNRRTAAQLRENARALGLLEQVQVLSDDCSRVVAQWSKEPWDLIFLDPPYEQSIAPRLFDALLGRIASEGRLVLERRARHEEPIPPGWQETFDRTWGEARVRVFVPEKPDIPGGDQA